MALKCHFDFLFLPKWQMIRQNAFLFLLISLPSLSHPQQQPDLTNGTWFQSPFAHLPEYTLFAPQTFCIYSLSSISLRTTVTLRRTCRLRFSSGGAHKVYYKRCANGECCLRNAESVILNKSPRESESITAVLCITTTVLKSGAVILRIHNHPPPPPLPHSIQC